MATIDGGFLTENTHKPNAEVDSWLDSLTADPEAEAREKQAQEYQRQEAQRREYEERQIAEQRAAAERAETQRQIAELRDRVSQGAARTERRASSTVVEDDLSQYDLTEEEKKKLGTADEAGLLQKFVQGSIAKARKKDRAEFDKKFAEQEERLKQFQQGAANNRVQQTMTSIETAVPDMRSLTANPAFASFMQERLLTPTGEKTRNELMNESHQAGNAQFCIATLNDFRRRITPPAQAEQEGGNARQDQFSEQVRQRGAQRSSAGHATGSPSLRNLGAQTQRTPSLEAYEKAYDELEARLRSGNATTEDKLKFDALSKRYEQELLRQQR